MSGKLFDLEQPKPEGDWIGWKAWMELHGSHHQAASVSKFALAAEKAKRDNAAFSLIFEREPTNPFDRNAIKVFGTSGTERWALGYVPKGEAADLGKFPIQMPISGRLISINFAGDRVYVRVQILVPSKRARLAEGWEKPAVR